MFVNTQMFQSDFKPTDTSHFATVPNEKPVCFCMVMNPNTAAIVTAETDTNDVEQCDQTK